jgi:hypothetical protein
MLHEEWSQYFESKKGLEYKRKLEQLFDDNFHPLIDSLSAEVYDSQKKAVIDLWTSYPELLLDAFLQLGRSKDKCQAYRSRPFRFLGFRLFS